MSNTVLSYSSYRWLWVSGIFTSSVAGLGLSPTFAWALLACALSGMTEMICSVANMTMVQLAAPEEMRGRIRASCRFIPR
jgi:hypothetical protein